MAERMLVPYDLRDQLRLLRWQFLHPRRFADYTHNTVQNIFYRDLCGLLLPEGCTPTVLMVIQKFSVGVTATRTYRENFALELDRAFQVEDSHLPERLMLHYRSGALGLVADQVLVLTPAAYKLIPYRRKLDAQVQRASGWMGTTLVLLPALMMTAAAAPPDVHWWLATVGAFGGMWWAFGLHYKKEPYARQRWQDDLRDLTGLGAGMAGLGLFALAVHNTALDSYTCLFLYTALMGLVYGVCAQLPVTHPAALLRWQIAVASTSMLLRFHVGGSFIMGVPLLVVLVITAAVSHRTLRNGLAGARRLLWTAFVVAYGLLALCMTVRLLT